MIEESGKGKRKRKKVVEKTVGPLDLKIKQVSTNTGPRSAAWFLKFLG